MRKIGRYFIALFICLAVIPSAYPSERIVNVFSEVDAEEVGLLDTFTLTVTVEGENIKRMPKPEVPDLKNFSILNESSRTQTSVQIINGKASRRKIISFTYLLKPEKKGTFTLDPVKIRYGGDIYKTDPITITVVEGKTKGEESTFFYPDGKPIDINKLKGDIFVRVNPAQSTLFEGEQLFLTYTLYSKLDIDSISLKQNPNFPGFYIEDIYNATRLEYKKETLDGRIYTTSLIKKVSLFPLKPGTYSPDPLVLEATVIVKGDDLFDVFGRPFTFDIHSNDFQIKVRSLPKSDSDLPFSGIVGSLRATLTSPVYTVRTGESMTCYLTLKSTGNLNVITDPGLKLSKRGRIYLSETMRNTVEEEKAISFVKKFEYTIIPEESGKLTISTQGFLFFNPENREYVVLKAEPTRLTITGENIARDKPIRGEKKYLGGTTLHFIKKDVKTLKSINTSPLQSYPFFVHHIALIAITAFFLLFIMKKEKLEKNEGLLKMRRAHASALKILEKTDPLIEKNDLDEAVTTVYRALTAYVADKARKTTQDITRKTVGSILDLIPGMNSKVRKDFLSLFETCMMVKFSTRQIDDASLVRDLKKRTINIIDQIESLAAQNHI